MKRALINFSLLSVLAASTAAAFEAPLVIAHRGASGLRPEHTEAAYQLAIEQGADFIEADLVMTKDRVLIVRHENEISATTDVADKFPKRKSKRTVDGKSIEGWFAEDFTFQEIQTLRARERLFSRDQKYNGQFRILSFEDFLKLAQRESEKRGRTIGVYIETKHPTYFKSIGLPLEAAVAASLRKHKLDSERAPAYLQSFELESLRDLKSRVQTRRVYLMDEAQVTPADFAAKKDRRTYGDLTTQKGLSEIKRVASGIGPYKRLIVPEEPSGKLLKPTTLVEDAHRAGLFVHPYTFRSDREFLAASYEMDPQNEYRQFFALGVDGVFSDFPADAVAARKRQSPKLGEKQK